MAKAKTKTVKRGAVKPQPKAAPKKALAKSVAAKNKTAAKPVAKAAAAKTVARAKPAAVAVAKPATSAASKPPAKLLALPGKPAARPAPSLAPPPARAAPSSSALRVDIPPASGFVLLVDGHFKNQFETLKSAKAAGAELLGRFPMLRIEVYDAVKRARLPI